MSKDGWFWSMVWTGKRAGDAASAIVTGGCPHIVSPGSQVVASTYASGASRLLSSVVLRLTFAPIQLAMFWVFGKVGFPLCSDTGRVFAVNVQVLFDRIQLLQSLESSGETMHLIFRFLHCSAGGEIRAFSQFWNIVSLKNPLLADRHNDLPQAPFLAYLRLCKPRSFLFSLILCPIIMVSQMLKTPCFGWKGCMRTIIPRRNPIFNAPSLSQIRGLSPVV